VADVHDVHERKTQTDLTLTLPKRLVARLEAFVALTEGSTSDLVEEALIPFLDDEEWKIAAIAEAVAASDAGEEPIEHEAIVEWLNSWGTENELPPPQ
jgi:predicted transcriptional regulator